jgi:hypothetical protein
MTILNLHLLRVSTMFHLLAALGSASLIVRWLASDEYVFKKVLAPVQIALLCSEKHLLLLSPFPIILSHFPIFMSRLSSWSAKRRWRFDLAALIVIVVADAIWIGSTVVENVKDAKSVSEWSVLGHWARQKTRSDAVFLIPALDNYRPASSREDEEIAYTLSGSTAFEYESHRRIWVAYKQGGAVMVKPSFYKTWWRRVSEGRASVARRKIGVCPRKHNRLRYRNLWFERGRDNHVQNRSSLRLSVQMRWRDWRPAAVYRRALLQLSLDTYRANAS